MNNFGKNLALWAIIGLLVIALFQLFQGPKSRGPVRELAFSEFLAEANSCAVREITIRGHTISGSFSDGRNFDTFSPPNTDIVALIGSSGVLIRAAPPDGGFKIFNVLLGWFPMLLPH